MIPLPHLPNITSGDFSGANFPQPFATFPSHPVGTPPGRDPHALHGLGGGDGGDRPTGACGSTGTQRLLGPLGEGEEKAQLIYQ